MFLLDQEKEGKFIYLYGGTDMEWIRKFTTTGGGGGGGGGCGWGGVIPQLDYSKIFNYMFYILILLLTFVFFITNIDNKKDQRKNRIFFTKQQEW